MLLDFGVTPYLVFDGDNLPSKAATNAARRKKREDSRALGLTLHKAGKTAQAQQELQKAIDVTPLMARQLIEELKKLNVQYIVAPYEADAQLVYLEQKGIIDGILAEDSDMLVFGARRLLTKLNQYGELVEIERADFTMCKEISLAGWTDTMFRRMAILSGCDYLSNIGKLGLKTAHSLVRKYNDVEKILRIVQLEGKLIVPTNYLDDFRHAELTFLHHRVFCPVEKKMVFLNELAPGMSESEMPFLGPHVDPETALGVACGDLDPFSKTAIQLDTKSFARPALGDRRRQSYASAPELKSKKSIDTFFKPHRQPLAELDPNSLTPSPSQQRLLERNRNASWEPRLVSSAPALRRSTTLLANSMATTDHSTFLARASTLSTYQPPKRQRLCSDSTDPLPVGELNQSPFFSSNQQEASPLAQKGIKSKKRQKSKFEVFSEDCNVPSEPTIQQAASPEKGELFTEPAQSNPLEATEDPTSQESIPQSSPVAPSPKQWRDSLVTPCRITGAKEISQDEDPEAFVDLLEYHVRKQNESLAISKQKGSLMQTFAFQQQQSRDRAFESLSSPKIRPKSFFGASEKVQAAALRNLPRASDVKSFCKDLDHPQTWDRLNPDAQQSALDSLNTQRAREESIYKDPATPADVVKHKMTIHSVRGSEDAIVPNSEDDSSASGSPERKAKFDLSAFAFVSA